MSRYGDGSLATTYAQADVLQGVLKERCYQDRKAARKGWDQNKSVMEWLTIMEAELLEAKNAWIKKGNKHALNEMLQVVAVGFACLERHGIVTRKDLEKG